MNVGAVFDGMLLPAVAIVFGACLGLLRGGKLRAVLGSPVHYWPILAAGMILHTLAEQAAIPGRLSVLVVGYFLLIVAALVNTHLKGAVVSGIGVTLNLAVLVANGYIPIRFDALVAVGEVEPGTDPALVTVSGLWRIEGTDTVLSQLGDIVPLGLFGDVVSFGDLILAGGLIVLTMNLVRHKRRISIEIDEVLGQLLDEEPLVERQQTIDVRQFIDLDDVGAQTGRGLDADSSSGGPK